MSYYKCPYPNCDKTFYVKSYFDEHMQTVHGGASPTSQGWFEGQTEKPDGTSKALLHEIAAVKSSLKDTERQPLQVNVPLPTPQKQQLQPVPNWSRGMDGSLIFEQKVGEHVTPLSSSIQILKGKISGNHFILTSYTYIKDLREIAVQEERRHILEARMQALTISDGAFVEVAKSIQETDHKLRDLRNGLSADSEISHIIEDYYRAEIGTQEYDDWRKKCMEQANTELSRLSKNFTSQIEDPTK